MKDWDEWRRNLNQDGDPDDTSITKKERKSRELFSTVIEEYIPEKTSTLRNQVDEWVNSLADDAQFNLSSYAECFVSENLLRKFIEHKNLPLSTEASTRLTDYKQKEENAKNVANISFPIRKNSSDLLYFSMDDLANFVDKPTDPTRNPGIARDAKIYKPVRDAVAHTSLITDLAKQSLSLTFENIKARIKKLLQ
jgi:hypothetical protein